MVVDPPSFFIRHYEPCDRAAIRRIAVETALAGRPASLFMDGNEILADLLTKYFTDYEPESSFVLEIQGQIVGYIIGSINTIAMEHVINRKIMWPVVGKALMSGFFLKKKNLLFLWHGATSLLRGDLNAPNFDAEFPATLHINLLEGARRQHGGSALMTAYLSYLAERKIKGVKMASLSFQAGDFFRRHGFSLLHQGRRTYFRHVTGQDYPLLIFGRKVSPEGGTAVTD